MWYTGEVLNKLEKECEFFDAVLAWQLEVDGYRLGPSTSPYIIKNTIVPRVLDKLSDKGIDTVDKLNAYLIEEDKLMEERIYRHKMYAEMQQKKLDDEIDGYILWKEKEGHKDEQDHSKDKQGGVNND